MSKDWLGNVVRQGSRLRSGVEGGECVAAAGGVADVDDAGEDDEGRREGRRGNPESRLTLTLTCNLHSFTPVSMKPLCTYYLSTSLILVNTSAARD